MTDLPHEHTEQPVEEHEATVIEHIEAVSDRTKAILGSAAVLGLAILIALQIFSFVDRASTRRELKSEQQYVERSVGYMTALSDRSECVAAKNDDYRFAEQRYLDSALTGPHPGEPSVDDLRAEWLSRFFKASGARDPALKTGCGPLPVPPRK